MKSFELQTLISRFIFKSVIYEVESREQVDRALGGKMSYWASHLIQSSGWGPSLSPSPKD